MRICFIRICVVLLVSIPLVCTEATIENGGYNVLVDFSQNMPSEIGTELIGEIETSLQEASQILFGAIGIRISKVTFDIPESWDVSSYNRTVEDSFNSDPVVADILIDDTNDTVFGNFPFAQQYGSCGVPGYQIIVPTSFFDPANEFPKGISLAREWLKYRYGVFDENGYIDDTLYPQYYQVPGGDANEMLVTHCSNSEIIYNFTNPETGEECPSDNELIGKLKDQECKIHINEENMTSSLMYFQESITTMTDICGKDSGHQHNSRSPNKQNVLCFGKSIWDIIEQSSDIKDEEAEKEYAEIAFVFSKKAKPRVVVAWENTEILMNQGKIILNAIKKLMIDLPNGSKFRAFPLKEGSDKNYTLEELRDVISRRSIASELKLDFDRQDKVDLKSGMRKAISILKTAAENPAKPPGNVIIITGTEDSIIVILLKDLHVCIKSFGARSFTDKDEIESDLPCLKVDRIPMSDEPEAIYVKLIEAMEYILSSKVEDKLTEMLKVEYINQTRSMEVTVDDFTESVTFSIFTDKHSDNFKLTSGKKEKKYLKAESYASDVSVLSYSLEAGIYNFSYPNRNAQSTLVEVKKTSKVGKYFSGKVAVVDTTKEDDKDQMPVIIYAIIRFGSYPVQNAKVSAIIQRPDADPINLDLIDDGRGDPDITRNDGVYSRYFTSFSSEGEYTVTVSVSNDELNTKYGENKTADYKSCCGSKLSEGTTELQNFVEVFETTFKSKGGRPEGGYKPSRITDLRISEVTDDGITLEWTAPGGEADSGAASRYAINLFCGEENTKECNIHEVIQVLNISVPLNYGENHQMVIRIIDKTKTLSISITAFNVKDERSESNVVLIFRSSETLPEITTKEPLIIKAQAPKIGTIIGWVIAGILIITCILGVVIYFIRKQKEEPERCDTEENKRDQKTKPTFEATDIPIKSAPVKKMESFPVMLYTHDQIKDIKNKESDQPLQKSNVPPKQWKSLDVMSFMEKKEDRDTKSLGSSSTVNI